MNDLQKQEMGERIAKRMKELNLTDVAVAEFVGLSKVSVGKWRKGDSEPTGRNLTKLVEILKTTPEYITTGEISSKPTIDQLRQQIAEIQKPSYNGLTFQDAEVINLSPANDDKVPVISWVAAGSWSNVEPVSIDDIAIKWISRPARLSKNGFALIVKGRSMYPEFKPDDIIFVEPETGFLKLKDGDLVVVSCNDDTEATFKQLVIGETSDDMYLKPLNPEWHEQKMLPIGNCNLVGKVIGKYVEY